MKFSGSAGRSVLAVGAALLLAACSGGGGTAAPSATPTAGATPFGPVLSKNIDPVNAALAQISGVKSLGEFDGVLSTLDTAAHEASRALNVADAPAAAAEDRHDLANALSVLQEDVANVRGAIKARDVCALSSAEAKLGDSQGLASVSTLLAKLSAVGYSASLSVPPLPKQQSRSLDNGTMVSKGKLRGEGVFKVDNGGKVNAVVSLVLNGKAVHSVFVAKGQKASVEGVEDGTYDVYVSEGADWDSATKAFTQNCAFTKFEDNFPYETGSTSTSWEITLQPVADGNAKTNDVDPNSFPQP
ncbi:hypothetical protein ACIG0C_35545 [Kitasatospora aureofaciens]|uniref:Lipoprotein n=1 Tax=Kitasatospora aureofaciens TaxID=1894 RepID=A0A1E7N4U0_KITAU|nr:hypothetical protein [Kitasatospora aureofaciens]ARF80912.1 hypothetical protein B6264_20150 [Kitasatospora aureofaciens]OEV35711.1 hypothetical protein HS99_0007380 [Kitasatospora aureofaciens]